MPHAARCDTLLPALGLRLTACSYGTVKEGEADQMLRNKALIIDEIESTLTDAVVQDLNSR